MPETQPIKKETLLLWLDRAITMLAEPLLDAFRRWNTETGAAADTTGGSFMELIGYILAILSWIQKRKGQPAPA